MATHGRPGPVVFRRYRLRVLVAPGDGERCVCDLPTVLGLALRDWVGELARECAGAATPCGCRGVPPVVHPQRTV
ncbi:MAG: hypothetical protein ACK5QW_06585 [Cyanobacteriota bacterium]